MFFNNTLVTDRLPLVYLGSSLVQTGELLVSSISIHLRPEPSIPTIINGRMRINYSFPFLQRVRLPNGMRIFWDGQSAVRIETPRKVTTCGLCGQHEKNVTGFDLYAGPQLVAAFCPSMNSTTRLGQQVSR
jgi:hypothetical protein